MLALLVSGLGGAAESSLAQGLGGLGGLGGGLGGNQFVNGGGAVGGVAVDARGVLTHPKVAPELADARRKAALDLPGDLERRSELRKVSLARLEAEIQTCLAAGKPVPDEILVLAGLERVTHVFIFPAERDVVLAGPADGWRIDPRGVAVGATNGLPRVMLDDLLVALRTAKAAARGEISCSIDPTPAGLEKLQQFLKVSKLEAGQELVTRMEQTLGAQAITLKGVPETSHFARVMVAADYRMKRLAMGHEEAPVSGLPSFLSMCKSGRAGLQNAMPRWWLATDYESLLRDPDGLAWQLRGPGVKCESQEDFLAGAGRVERGAGGANPTAQRWAKMMTTRYDALAVADPVFGQLRNCMDLAVVAALMTKEDLATRANYAPSLLLSDADLPLAAFNPPRQVDSTASLVRRSRDWIVSVSGGVQINAASVASANEENADLARLRQEATLPPNRWWWD